MRIISIMLMAIGLVGLFLSTVMFGDIALAAAIGSITAILSGVGFHTLNKQINVNDSK